MSVRELAKEEKHINEMFDGLEAEITKRLERAVDRGPKDSLMKQLEALKKGRIARLDEWRKKSEALKSE